MSSDRIGRLFCGLYQVPLFLVESYWPGVSVARVAAADAKTLRALEELGDRSPVAQHLGSILVPGDELLLRVFAGGSIAEINEANARAGIPVERVVVIRALPPSPPPKIGKHPMQRPPSHRDHLR